MHSHIVAHQTFAQSLVSWLLGILDYSSSFRALLGTLLISYMGSQKSLKVQTKSYGFCSRYYGGTVQKKKCLKLIYLLSQYIPYMEFLKSGLLYKSQAIIQKKLFLIFQIKKIYFQDHCFWKFLISQEVAWVFPEVPDQNLL